MKRADYIQCDHCGAKARRLSPPKIGYEGMWIELQAPQTQSVTLDFDTPDCAKRFAQKKGYDLSFKAA